MARVTLEGSITPSTFLARGARITVERTPYVDKLIRAGYVNVVEAATPAIVTVQDAMAEVEQYIKDGPARAEIEREETPAGPPSLTALKSTWAEFLTNEQIAFPEGATKTEMIALWNEANDGGSDDQ